MRRLIIIAMLCLASATIAGVVSDDDALLSTVTQRADKLKRVTEKPQPMTPSFSGACSYSGATTITSGTLNAGSPDPAHAAANPHAGKSFRVYMSGGGVDAVTAGKGVFPEGTMVLKEKYSDAGGKATELFTGMLKREKGFNPQGGDWEYFVVSGDAKKIVARGKIESCANCHASYQSTDFVTREYTDTEEPPH